MVVQIVGVAIAVVRAMLRAEEGKVQRMIGSGIGLVSPLCPWAGLIPRPGGPSLSIHLW